MTAPPPTTRADERQRALALCRLAFGVGRDAEAARMDLTDAHMTHLRLDPLRVHRTWWARELRGESPAVVRAVVSRAPRAIRAKLVADLDLTDEDLVPDATPSTGAVEVALALWSRRLAIGMGPRPEDSIAVRVLTRSDARGLHEFARVAGTAKLAHLDEAPFAAGSLDYQMWEFFHRKFAGAGPGRRDQAARDRDAASAAEGDLAFTLGLIGVGRLLAAAGPERSRWARQHVPVSLSKSLKGSIPATGSGSDLVAWEAELIEAAADVLDPQWRTPDEVSS